MKDEHYTEYRNLGLTIAHFRRLKGMTQQQLADVMHVNYETISRIENANTGISSDMLFDLSKALQISLSEILAHAQL